MIPGCTMNREVVEGALVHRDRCPLWLHNGVVERALLPTRVFRHEIVPVGAADAAGDAAGDAAEDAAHGPRPRFELRVVEAEELRPRLRALVETPSAAQHRALNRLWVRTKRLYALARLARVVGPPVLFEAVERYFGGTGLFDFVRAHAGVLQYPALPFLAPFEYVCPTNSIAQWLRQQ